MTLIDTIWRKIVDIENRTLNRATHVEVPRNLIPEIVAEYNELANHDYEQIMINGLRKYTILDVEDYFGNVRFTVALRDSNDIKVLKEITPYSE